LREPPASGALRLPALHRGCCRGDPPRLKPLSLDCGRLRKPYRVERIF
jgi:hypothetical protein